MHDDRKGPAFGHVGLNVTDLSRSLRFYRQVLGFRAVQEVEQEGQRYAFLGDGERIVLTLWQQADAGFAAATAGLHHLAFEVPSMADVEAVTGRLAELGTEPLHGGPVAHREGSASGGVFFADPDGTRLEVFAAGGAEALRPAVAGAPSCGFF